MAYTYLGSPCNIGVLTIKNRVVMAAIGSALANPDGTVNDTITGYYAERAKGGVGLIMTGVTSVNEGHGVASPGQLRASEDKYIPELKKLADAVHAYETKLFVQLQHSGRQKAAAPGQSVVGPSAIPCGFVKASTRALTGQEVKELIQDFIQASKRVQLADMDGVEIHAAHGYLLHEFLSPYSNVREDAYGGSFENRMRILREIIAGIKKECGADFPVSVRLSVNEYLETIGKPGQGITLEEGVKIAVATEQAGADVISVSTGLYETINTISEPPSYAQGWKLYNVEAVKQAVGIPVIGAAGVVREPAYADALVREKKLDFVALGRPLLCDPAWTRKALEGKEQEIRKCICCLYCFESLFARDGKGPPLRCALNPTLAYEDRCDGLQRDGNGRVVAVVGAGPAGLESARILGARGFQVELFDKGDTLGGAISIASVPPHKERLHWIVDYYKSQFAKYAVNLHLGSQVSAEQIQSLRPYATLIATGAVPTAPKAIRGMKSHRVCQAVDVLAGKVPISNETVLVIGSGLTGLETAEFLVEQGNKVGVADLQTVIGAGIYFQVRMDLMERLAQKQVAIMPGHKLTELANGVATFQTEGGTVALPADRIVLALGLASDDSLYQALQGQVPRLHLLGDARTPARFYHAIRDGFETAYHL